MERSEPPSYCPTPDQICRIRHRILRLSYSAKSAHVGSALSCMEILAALFSLKKASGSKLALEKLILSKGHAAMALYAVAEHFKLVDSSLLDQYLQDGTKLWGHPAVNPDFPFIDWSTGSLGHGLPVAAGFAFSRKVLAKKPTAVVAAVLSDGECDEGTVWEAALFAGHHRLGNLIVIIDFNKIQSFGRCVDILNLEPFADKWRSFGWDVSEVDGHDLGALSRFLMNLDPTKSQPTCLIAHTIKGKGVRDIENTVASHYKPITKEQLEAFEL